MKLIALNCNNCGAKLKVGESAKFVTCKHCETQLAIHHEEGSAYTELAEATKRVEERTEELAEHVEELAGQNRRLLLQNELEDLDRKWESERQPLMSKAKDGTPIVPTRNQATALAFLSPLGLLLFIIPMPSGSDLPAFFWLFALAIAAASLFGAKQLHTRAVRYERALADHEAARAALCDEIAQLKSPKGKKKKKKRVTT